MRKLPVLFLLLSLFLFTQCSTENTPIYSLTTNVNPSEAGSINPSSGEYDEGTEVELMASPNEHWIFNGWQGDHSGNQNPASIVMDSDKSITAQFIKRDYPLTINVEGEGHVEEEIIQQKTTDYPHGTIVQLTANPAEGWEFIEWSGHLDGSENPQTITIQDETSVNALFEEIKYSIDVNTEGEGSINLNPNKDFYVYGDEVIITVETENDWNFVHWKGDLEGTDNPQKITINQNINAIAVLDNSPFDGGNGSEQYPYMISTIYQLQEIINYTNKHFIQIDDINADETREWNDGKGFQSIGDDIIRFRGSYDGRNFKIDQLYIDRESEIHMGLFGFIDNATIDNVILTNAFVNGSSDSGGLIGQSENGKVYNAHVSGIVKSNGVNVGGLMGRNRNGEILFSSSNCDVSTSGFFRVGGLVGFNLGTIENSFSNGKVSSDSPAVGGLVGLNWSLIKNSYSIAEVHGEENVGGLVAINSGGTIENSYSHGTVHGYSEVGGLVGLNSNGGKVTTSMSVSEVIGQVDVGGLIGLNGEEVQKNYCDMVASNQDNCIGRGITEGVTGLTTTQMTGSSAQENMADFDWETVWNTTSGYPILRWQEE